MGVRQMAYQLWHRYSASHKVRFISVDFAPVVAEILSKIDDGQMGVVLKRMMVRVASQIAKRFKINALVTGEALGQVASQTLTNLSMIDKASDTLILRPLITHDKASIIAITEQIGVADIAKSMPEFCGVISKSPTVKAHEHKLIATESEFDFAVLDQAVQEAKCFDIRQIIKADTSQLAVTTVTQVEQGEVVIDIRTPDEAEDKPLNIAGVLAIPFYKLAQTFATLEPSKTYLLYCERGVMSQLQAVHLKDKGFDNVKVLKLER